MTEKTVKDFDFYTRALINLNKGNVMFDGISYQFLLESSNYRCRMLHDKML